MSRFNCKLMIPRLPHLLNVVDAKQRKSDFVSTDTLGSPCRLGKEIFDLEQRIPQTGPVLTLGFVDRISMNLEM